MVTALNDTEVEAFRQSLAEMTDFRLFPLLAETVLWGRFSARTQLDRSQIIR